MQQHENQVKNEPLISPCRYCTSWISRIWWFDKIYWEHSFCASCDEWKNLFDKRTQTAENSHKKRIFEIKQSEKLLKKSWVSERFRQKRLNDLMSSQSLHTMMTQYCLDRLKMKESWRWFYFRWWVGTWKTRTATALCNELIERYWTQVMFLNFWEAANRVKKTFWKENEEDSTLFEEMKDVDLLVIDDIWIEKPTDWMNEQLFLIINYRYEKQKPVVLTSNQSLEDLWNLHKKQVISRLKEMCKIIYFGKVDKRSEKRPNF